MAKTFFEKFYDRLQEIVKLDRQLQPVDEMLDKNIDALPGKYAEYIRASLKLVDMLRHDHKFVDTDDGQ